MNTLPDLDKWVTFLTDRVMEQLQKKAGPSVITIGGSHPDYNADLFCKQLAKKYRKLQGPIYLIQKLSLTSLSRLATLQASTAMEQEVQTLLEKGETVFILKQGRTYQHAFKHGKYGLKDQIKEFENKLYRFGVEFINLQEK